MSSSETPLVQKTKSLLSVGTIPKGEQFFVPSSNKNSNAPIKGPPIPRKETLKTT